MLTDAERNLMIMLEQFQQAGRNVMPISRRDIAVALGALRRLDQPPASVTKIASATDTPKR